MLYLEEIKVRFEDENCADGEAIGYPVYTTRLYETNRIHKHPLYPL